MFEEATNENRDLQSNVGGSGSMLDAWGAALAHPGSCSNASLIGRYGQTISGEILPGNGGVWLPQNGVAMTNFDGKRDVCL